jgi:hypothetical protein
MTDQNAFAQQMAQAVYTPGSPKAYSDKLLAQDEVNEMKELIQRDYLTAGDLRRLGYLLSGNELKLVYLDPKERYLICKYLTWIHKAITVQQTRLRNIGILREKGASKIGQLAIMQAYNIMDEDIKKMIGVYLALTRSSLSINGKAFVDLSTNRNETVYNYNQVPSFAQQGQNQGQQGGGWFGNKK